VGSSRFPAKEAVILGVPAPSKLLRLKTDGPELCKNVDAGF
jgi:hypothetical protein